MSLLVWLPLNGDLHNQGLSDVETSAVGAAIAWAPDGKMGEKCFSGGTTYVAVSSITLGENVSIAVWAKTTDGGMFWVLEADETVSSYPRERLNFYKTNGKYFLNVGDSQLNPFIDDDGNPLATMPNNEWHHYTVTFNGSVCRLYIDGSYRGKSQTYRSPVIKNKKVKIGGGFYDADHTYDLRGFINDVRVYDHCLSPKEVKEIAKGLMVHYTIDVSANMSQSANTLYDYSIQDVSGFGNNAEMKGFTDATHVSSDTRRYQKSLLFDTNTYIVSDKKANEFLPHDELTANIWIKCTQWASPLSCTQDGGFGFYMPNAIYGICFYVLNAGNIAYKISQSKVPASAILNGWHMLTGTYNKNTANIYIDGVLKGSVAVGNDSGIKYNTTNYLCIAAEASSGYTPENKLYCGNISDVRIYSTSLSADDVAELYNTTAVTDKQGNFHCYEAIEDGVASITKTGIAKFNIDERDRGSGVTIYSTVQPNLLLGTRRDNVRYEVTGATTEIGLRLTPAVQLQISKKYTFSAMIRGFANIGLYTINSGGSAASPNERFDYISKSEMSTQDFKLFSVTFKVTKDVTSINQIYPCTKYGPANTQVGDWFEIQADSIKLEEGEMCTPWIPDANDNEYRSYDNLLSTAQLIEI